MSKQHWAAKMKKSSQTQGVAPVDSITVKDFRCFHDEQTVRLAPLTLLVGENSTGKTSFMAMIRALWDFGYDQQVPNFQEKPFELGSFDEIVHNRGRGAGRGESFEAGFEFSSKDSEEDPKDIFLFKSVFRKNGTEPIPIMRYLSNDDSSVWIKHSKGEDGLWRPSFGVPNLEWEINFALRMDESPIIPFHILSDVCRRVMQREELDIVINKGSGKPSDDDWDMIERICHSEHVSGKYMLPLYASAPVRSRPKRTYDPSSTFRDPEGDYVPMFLGSAHFMREENKEWSDIKSALEKFGKESELFDEISVKRLGKTMSEPFQLQFRKFDRKSKGPHHNLIDIGYGVSQALPILTELLRSERRPMFLLQQPEVHLHPSAQAALGTFFCELSSSEYQLIVETHSDHLIDRIRMDIRDERANLTHKDVSILYFERKGLDVTIHSLRLDEAGNVRAEDGVSPPPESYGEFFMETTRRLFGLEY